MVEPKSGVSKPKQKPTSESVTTRVTVAFPFSQIKMQEPSEDLAALATVVRELADLVAEAVPGSSARDLRKRARVLSARLAER